MRSRASTRPRSRGSRQADARYGVGPARTITSAASALSAGRALQVTRVGTARHPPLTEGCCGVPHPADVTALGTTRVLPGGAAARGFPVEGPATKTAHAFEDGQVWGLVSRIRVHVDQDSALCGNLRGARCDRHYGVRCPPVCRGQT